MRAVNLCDPQYRRPFPLSGENSEGALSARFDSRETVRIEK